MLHLVSIVLCLSPVTEPMLPHPVQLTTSAEFHKAGEAYFSDDGSRLIFQAIPAVAEGETPTTTTACMSRKSIRGARGSDFDFKYPADYARRFGEHVRLVLSGSK